MSDTFSSDIQSIVDNINTTFNLATEEYIIRYPPAKMNPDVETYQAPLQNAINSINEVNAELFLLESELYSNIENHRNNISVSNNKITELKTSNKKLEKNIDNIKGSNKGSIKRYRDSQKRSFLDLYSSIALAFVAYYTFNKMYDFSK